MSQAQQTSADDQFRPLNPSDQVLLAIDQQIRNDGNPGSICGFALELQGDFDVSAFRLGVSALQTSFPALSSTLEQRGKIYGWTINAEPIPIHLHLLEENLSPKEEHSQQHQSLLRIMNQAQDISTDAPLEFHLITGQQHSLLLLRWLHPLLDARGAKLIFDFLMSDKRERYSSRDFSLIEQRFKSWSLWEKLKMAYRGKQYNAQIDRLKSALPAVGNQQAQQLDFSSHTFSILETGQIMDKATQTVGMGSRSLYLIGCLMRALDAAGMAEKNDAYCIPYAFNLRQPNAPVPLLGNHVSILFSQAPHALVADRKALFKHLRDQYTDTIRKGLDYSFLPWMWVGRWMSLQRYGQVLRQQPDGGERGSLWFSDIGEMRFAKNELCGATISGMRHMCYLTAPPSLAVLFGQFQGKLSVSYNYLKPDIGVPWLEKLQRALAQELLDEK